MSAAESAPLYAVVYDGHCAVCGKIVARLDEWDSGRKLELIPSQDPGVRGRFPWISERDFAGSLQVVRIAGGKTWQGAPALEQLLHVLPRGRWISWVFALPFARQVVERAYRWFARNRYRLGCGKHCAPHGRAGNG